MITRLALGLILAFGAYLRFSHPDWDGYQHTHPDERYITWVATSIDLPHDLRDVLDLSRTSLDPFRWPPEVQTEGIVVETSQMRAFTYGHLPLYGLVAAEKALTALGRVWSPPSAWAWLADLLNTSRRLEYDHLAVVGRALSALYDTLTILFTFLLARCLFRSSVGEGAVAGLFAAALVALAVLHIQLAHFAAFDPAMAMFVTAALWRMAVSIGESHSNRYSGFLAPALVGLAVGSKLSASLLIIPLAVVSLWPKVTLARLGRLCVSVVVAFLAFALTNPFALLDFGRVAVTVLPFSVKVDDGGFAYDVTIQSGMVRGQYDFPFVRQYLGTPAFWYYVEQQGRWALGWPMTVAMYSGLAWGLVMFVGAIRRNWSRKPEMTGLQNGIPTPTPGLAVVLAWTVPYFLVTGAFFVKFPRYMLPVLPAFAVLAGGLIAALAARRRAWAAGLAAGVLLPSLAYSIAFVNMYAAPHPWLTASEWIYRNLPKGAAIATERYDDRLPLSRVANGLPRKLRDFWPLQLDPWAGPDEETKLAALLAKLSNTDYVVLASNRNYGVAPKVAGRFPLTAAYYRALFAEALGFRLVFTTDRHPTLGNLALQDDPVAQAGLPRPALMSGNPAQAVNFGPIDESLTVYDHPRVLIFGRVESLTVDQLRSAVEAYR